MTALSSRYRRLPAVVLTAFLLAFAARVVALMALQSPSVDEVIHIPAGYAYLEHGDFSLNPEHPPLAKLAAAFGLRVAGASPAWRPGQPYPSFFDTGWPRLTLAARLPMLGFSLGTLLVLFALLRRLFDPLTAALATGAFSLQPVFVAHAVFVHTDVPAALFYLGACALVLRRAETPGWGWRLGLAAVIAAGALCKFSLLAAGPITLAALLVALPRRRWLPDVLGLALLSALALVLLAQLAYSGASAGPEAATVWGLPAPLVEGVSRVVRHDERGHAAFLLGEQIPEGSPAYFPVAYALKTPVPLLLTLLIGLVVLLRSRPSWLPAWGVFALAYWVAAMASSINIGIRHLLPAIAVMGVALGAGVQWLLAGKRRRLAGGALLVWLAGGSAAQWNGELGAFGELALGRPGWRLLADSNVDWGQQLASLGRYAAREGLDPLYVELFSPFDLDRFGASAEPLAAGLDAGRLRPGHYAISAHWLAVRRGWPYGRFKEMKPERSFGGSILLYRVAPPSPGP